MAKGKKGEIRYEVKRIEVHKKCPACGKGHMVATEKVEFGDVMLFPHKCDGCGYEESYRNTYPYTKYEYFEVKK